MTQRDIAEAAKVEVLDILHDLLDEKLEEGIADLAVTLFDLCTFNAVMVLHFLFVFFYLTIKFIRHGVNGGVHIFILRIGKQVAAANVECSLSFLS